MTISVRRVSPSKVVSLRRPVGETSTVENEAQSSTVDRALIGGIVHQDRTKLSEDEIQEELKALANWEIVEGKLHREFKFENFIEAFAFMTKLAMVAERLNHHPEWTNVYNKVSLWLTTHDVDGISRFDFDLAQAANRYYGE